MKSSIFSKRTIGCIYNTRRGTIYQLSDYNQNLVSINTVQINLQEFLEKKYVFEMLEEGKINFQKYLNLEKYENYLTLYNSNTSKKILGSSKDDAIKIFFNGYKELDFQELLTKAEQIKPDVLVSFGEIPEIVGSGQKSNKRAIAKNFAFLERAIGKFKELGTLVFAPIVATKFHKFLEESITQLQGIEPDGYVIQGLHKGETLEERNAIYSIINQAFAKQDKKTRNIVLSSLGEPCDILHAISYGIFFFESEYPFKLAEQGQALHFNFEQFNEEGEAFNEEQDVQSYFKPNLVAKFLDLKDQKSKLALEPLIKGCECYTCKNHTQAYIHHLLECDEMTANVLLTIHNVFVYQKFLDYLQVCESKGQIDKFIKWFMSTQSVTQEQKTEEKK